MAHYHFDGTITKEVSIWVEAENMEDAEKLAKEACESGDYDDGQSLETYKVEFDCKND